VRIIINITASVRAAALLATVATVALSGCASRLPEPNAADAARAAKVWPGTTVNDLHRGKLQYMQRCSACHGLIDPRQFEAAKWPGFVQEMSGKLQITRSEVVDLTRYLVVASESRAAH
jgi:cytochrome c5